MTERHPHIVIEKRKRGAAFNFRELINYKDLLYFMILRDFTVVYKQSVLGLTWAFINPIFSILVFSIVFGRLAGVPSDGIPYPIFSCAGILPWTYFANTINASGSSLVNSSGVFTKVYFPRLIIPIVPVLTKLVDFAISFVLLIGMMVYYKCYPSLDLFAIPLFILIMVVASAGLGAWLSSLAIQYRDVKFGLSFAVPLLMYAAPVVFPASLILEKFGEGAYLVYGLYPMVGVIEGFRSAIIPAKEIPWSLVGMSAVGAILLLVIGLRVFKNLESRFADVA
ncbi:MAG: ABC transporter permease [Daejeonella sp.]